MKQLRNDAEKKLMSDPQNEQKIKATQQRQTQYNAQKCKLAQEMF
jgi:hypothetical protein